MKPPRREVLNALQGLRGLAAILVVCDHALTNRIQEGSDKLAFAWFLGDFGVRIFFVISGFVMIYAHRRDFGSSGKVKIFALRRIGRIVPLYWLLTISYALYLSVSGRVPSWLHLAQSMLFIPYQGADTSWRPVLGQGWTLNYEMIFYLVFCLSLFFTRGLFIVFGTLLLLMFANNRGLFGHGNVVEFWSEPIVFYFLCGMGLGLLRPLVSVQPSFLVALGLSIVFLAAGIAAAAYFEQGSAWTTLATVLTSVAAVAACCWSRETAAHSLLQRVAMTAGNATYSIYLTHTLVIGPSAKAVGHFAPHTPNALFIAIMLPFTIFVGILVYHWVERPLVKWFSVHGMTRSIPRKEAVASRS